MATETEYANDFFTPEELAEMAENAPVVGEGLKRDYQLEIHNCVFQLASDEYQAQVIANRKPDPTGKKRYGKAIQIVFEGKDAETGEERNEKYTIGDVCELDGGEGTVAPRIKFVEGVKNLSGNSLYGRLYDNLISKWGVISNPEDPNYNLDEYEVDTGLVDQKTGDPVKMVIGPDGLRFTKHVRRTLDMRRPDPRVAAMFVGLTLQMAKEEFEVVKGKGRFKKTEPKERAFPVGIVKIEGEPAEGEEESAPKSKETETTSSANGSSNGSAKSEAKSESKPEPKTEPKTEAKAESAEKPDETDILFHLRDLASKHAEAKDFAKEAIKYLKTHGVATKALVNFAMDKNAHAALAKGEGNLPGE